MLVAFCKIEVENTAHNFSYLDDIHDTVYHTAMRNELLAISRAGKEMQFLGSVSQVTVPIRYWYWYLVPIRKHQRYIRT